ncbi:unnamed protein product [Sphenostylis stenocarpa]|uniref:Uncharacterized protein n=1 Tax=Sphenostylis stenocarpa TaxID=92480 RepID=A0AA86VCW1_9FABA|nr:unnamed protein product [Sphenostylis stenocarpa]
MYVIGGSANPTILSEGNFYVAPNDPSAKQVEIVAPNDPTIGSCAPNYSPSQSLSAAPAYMIPAITLNAPENAILNENPNPHKRQRFLTKGNRTLKELKKRSGVGDIVANNALGCDSDLILVDWRLGLRLLHLLVPIHGYAQRKRNRMREKNRE